MKALIIGFVILILFLGFYYFIFQSKNISNNSFKSAVKELSEADTAMSKIEPFLKKISSIKNLNDFKEFVKKDTQIVSYEFDDKIDYYDGFIFEFDNNKQLKRIRIDSQHLSSELNPYSEDYPPIISYIFEHSNYDKVNWGLIHLSWLFFLIIFAIFIIINSFQYLKNKNIKNLYNVIIFLLFVLAMDTFHLVLSNKFYIDNDAQFIISSIPSRTTMFKVIGIISNYQAMIFDANMIAIILLFVFIILLIHKNKATV